MPLAVSVLVLIVWSFVCSFLLIVNGVSSFDLLIVLCCFKPTVAEHVLSFFLLSRAGLDYLLQFFSC